jgi:hypothetical protein
MKNQQHPMIVQVVRFGLPLVVAVYYATAARGFPYTADCGYAAANWSALLLGQRTGLPGTGMFSLFWTVLLALGGTLGLDLLLVGKIMSLLFACFGVLGLYLLGVEILDDRILAFSAALIVALDPLLLQAGPCGTPATALMALSTASLFFTRRRDFALAAVFAGLGTVLAWPAAVLMVSLGLEVRSLSDGPSRSETFFGACAVFLAVVLPWMVFAWAKGLPLVSDIGVPGSALAIGWWTLVPALLCVLMTVAGIVVIHRSRLLQLVLGEPSWGVLAWILWVGVAGFLCGRDFWLAGSPLLLLGAMQGLRAMVPALREEVANYSVAFGATALLLVVNQAIFLTAGKESMNEALEAEQDAIPSVQWISARLPAAITIESEVPGLTECLLRSGQRVSPRPASVTAEYVLSSEKSIQGYREIFRSSQPVADPLETGAGRFALFQRIALEK